MAEVLPNAVKQVLIRLTKHARLEIWTPERPGWWTSKYVGEDRPKLGGRAMIYPETMDKLHAAGFLKSVPVSHREFKRRVARRYALSVKGRKVGEKLVVAADAWRMKAYQNSGVFENHGSHR